MKGIKVVGVILCLASVGLTSCGEPERRPSSSSRYHTPESADYIPGVDGDISPDEAKRKKP